MIYTPSNTSYTCTCPPTWIASGDSCIKDSDINSLPSVFNAQYGRQVTYYSVVDINGDLVNQTLQNSDTFNYFYNDAAIGC